jgi:hypothetical protein
MISKAKTNNQPLSLPPEGSGLRRKAITRASCSTVTDIRNTPSHSKKQKATQSICTIVWGPNSLILVAG